MILRDYQEAAVDSLFKYWERGRPLPLPDEEPKPWGHPVIGLPTGTGKAGVIGGFAKKAINLWPNTRILVLTHVKELIAQNYKTLLRIWPTASVGIYSDGLKRRDIGRDVTFAGIGTVAGKMHLFKPDIIIVDECQTVSPKEDTMYRKAFADAMALNPFCKVVGLSATLFRMGQGMLIEPGGIFTDVAFNATDLESFNWFLSEGYLAPLVPKPTETEYDISSVRRTAGDFNLKDLQAAVDKDALTRKAVAEIIAKGSDRSKWLIFGAGIQHAEHITQVLWEHGIAAACVHSKSGDDVRDEAVKAFKRGEIRALVNNGIFTTGFDDPEIDLIAVIRHTTSPGLWVQILGRGTRPVWPTAPGQLDEWGDAVCNWHLWPEGKALQYDISTREGRLACIAEGPKRNCLVLDFAGNTKRLGPINDPKIPNARKKGDKPGDIPAKLCEACMTYNHVSARVCSECGEEFQFRVNLHGEASTDELIRGVEPAVLDEPREEWFNVKRVEYSKHVPWNGKRRRFGQPVASLRVCYDCGVQKFHEFVCLEHDGFPRDSAAAWWKEGVQTRFANAADEVPATVDDALQIADRLQQPSRIRVWINRKNPSVQFRDFQTEILES